MNYWQRFIRVHGRKFNYLIGAIAATIIPIIIYAVATNLQNGSVTYKVTDSTDTIQEVDTTDVAEAYIVDDAYIVDSVMVAE